jgi:5-methylcytosine-specific restriction protein A
MVEVQLSELKIPNIQKSKRSREWSNYSDQERAEVVKGWLFEGFTHRELDEKILNLDASISRGYQSMDILHYLGLKRGFRGIFRQLSVEDAIQLLLTDTQDFSLIVSLLQMASKSASISYQKLLEKEYEELESSLLLSEQSRRNRIKISKQIAEKVRVYSFAFKRNADIVVEALNRSEGHCELCKSAAPFRRSDGSVYLEVHHIVSLADGGADSLMNVAALCPNCHREAHFGMEISKIKALLLKLVAEKEEKIL